MAECGHFYCKYHQTYTWCLPGGLDNVSELQASDSFRLLFKIACLGCTWVFYFVLQFGGICILQYAHSKVPVSA